ncbi:TRAP transporter small permease subunit [Alphaproteobacteria bacterium GH1-50]|uniref:TRAP transporter small permease protein n=1 Tax=Kangsaoukella pontilimi TaxID=2691042 RepID=A0A7C9MT17_9RHOB|nr:TRAP transporter small permease [Kangsaoukella pontilimi]MXQ09797.1 TRAP transporter small permease subunit [Kangsaoukella pontilimi]
MGHLLDRVYLGAAWIAAFTILAIALLISAQIFLNFSTRALSLPLPSTIPSYADFSGFMLAAATFLAMPYTFRSGGHIRVSLITARLMPRARLVCEIAALAGAAFLTGFAVYFIWVLVAESVHYGDVSNGTIPVPLWIPQSAMGVGMTLLCISAIHSLVETLLRGAPVIAASEEV